MKTYLKLLFIGLLFFQSCNLEKCEELSCFSPPNPFSFELIDKTSGENLFTNGTYDPSQIEVENLNGSETIDFIFIEENDLNLIEFRSIGWETGITNLSLSVGSNNIFELYVDAERIDDCCPHTLYNEVRIDKAEYESDPTTGVIRIFVE